MIQNANANASTNAPENTIFRNLQLIDLKLIDTNE